MNQQKDIKWCQQISFEIKNFLAHNYDRFKTVCFLHDERVKVFRQMRDIDHEKGHFPTCYTALVNYIDLLDVLMEEDRDITQELKDFVKEMDLILGVKKN